MKDLFTILADNQVEITDEQKSAIKKEFNENYKTIAEFNKKVDEIKTKDEELDAKGKAIDEMKTQIEALESDNAGIEDLKSKIADYEKAEQDRKDNAEKEKKIEGLKARFSPLKGDKNYFNEYVENGIFEEFCKALDDEANTGKSDAEIYEALTKDKNIYANPNQVVDIPGASSGGEKENDAIEKARAIMGLKKKGE